MKDYNGPAVTIITCGTMRGPRQISNRSALSTRTVILLLSWLTDGGIRPGNQDQDSSWLRLTTNYLVPGFGRTGFPLNSMYGDHRTGISLPIHFGTEPQNAGRDLWQTLRHHITDWRFPANRAYGPLRQILVPRYAVCTGHTQTWHGPRGNALRLRSA